jgi:hypothetical protein
LYINNRFFQLISIIFCYKDTFPQSTFQKVEIYIFLCQWGVFFFFFSARF